MRDFVRLDGDLVTAAEAGAIEVVAAHAAERLAAVCAGWPSDRFRSLVLDVARVQLRFGIPRAEFESLRREWERRALATHHDVAPPAQLPEPLAVLAIEPPVPATAPDAPADLRPPVQLPASARGFPAFLDRPASAPT